MVKPKKVTSALKEETDEPACSLSTLHLKIQEARSGPLPDTGSIHILILNFAASRIVRNKCLLFISYRVYAVLLQLSEQTNTWQKT